MEKCKICGNENVIDYFPPDKRIKKCRVCGVGFLDSGLFGREPDYYEDGSSYSAILADENRIRMITANAEDQLGLIANNLKPQAKKLLDIGAHTGQFVKEAAGAGFIAEGIEPNRTAVEWAQNRKVPVIQAELDSFNPEKKFDVITMFHVLEHLTNPVGSISKIKNLLSENGYFVVEVPNADSYMAKLDGISWKFVALEHLFYFTEKSLKDVIKKSGFSVIYSQNRNFEINYLNPRKLMRYLIGSSVKRDRLKEKNVEQNNKASNFPRGMFHRFIQKLMVILIHMLKREDHIFIIARKNA